MKINRDNVFFLFGFFSLPMCFFLLPDIVLFIILYFSLIEKSVEIVTTVKKDRQLSWWPWAYIRYYLIACFHYLNDVLELVFANSRGLIEAAVPQRHI